MEKVIAKDTVHMDEIAAFATSVRIKGQRSIEALFPANIPNRILHKMARCLVGLGVGAESKSVQVACCELGLDLAMEAKLATTDIGAGDATHYVNLYALRLVEEAMSRHLLVKAPALTIENFFDRRVVPTYFTETPTAALISVYQTEMGVVSKVVH